MFANYLKIAWRNLIKNKVTGLINILGLIIGIAVAMMIAFWVIDELDYNKNHKNYDRLAQLYITQTFNNKTSTFPSISIPEALVLRNDFQDDVENIALSSWNFQHILGYEEKRFIWDGMQVESTFPKMFGLELISGNYEDVLKDPNNILLSKSSATALFGDEDPFGKTIRFDASTDLIVSGVYKDVPRNSKFHDVKFLGSWDHYVSQNSWIQRSQDQWGNHSFQCFILFKDHVNIKQFSTKIKDLEKAHNEHGNPELLAFPMAQWHLHSNFKDGKNIGGRIQFVWLFGIIGMFVLLLACINFMNLSTARSEKRAKEVGIRKAVGSLKSQLVGQFLTESLLVTSIAFVFALALVQICLPSFNELADKQLSIPLGSAVFWVSTISLTLFTGIVAGSYPAFYLSSFEPITALKGTFRLGRKASLPRQVLVTLQFTISIALIIGTLVVYQQIQHAKNRPVGFDQKGIFYFFSNNELKDKFEQIRTQMLATGVVDDMSSSSSPITQIWSNQDGFEWEGMDPETSHALGIVACSHELGKTVGWEIKEGRDFSREFSTDTSALILNESAVQLMGIEDIVNKSIKWRDEPYKVVGVVKDMLMESPWTPIKPTVFHINSGWANIYTVRLKSGVLVKDALSKVQKVYEKMSPGSPFEFKFIDDEHNKKFLAEARIGSLSRIFAILAIFISCLGLFGLSAFVAEQRTKEIGIRKVLGASVANLWALQSKSFVILVLLACIIASPIAWYFLSSWLTKYEYRINLEWDVFLIAGVLALVVTLFTVSFQSIKAAMSNPVKSLKSE